MGYPIPSVRIGGRVVAVNQGFGGALRLPKSARGRKWLAAVGVALVFAGCWAGAGHSSASAVALPQFLPPPAKDAAHAAPRTGLLPECTQVLPDSIDPAALLAQPTGSVAVHGVVGTPAPSVDLLARTSCTYRRSGGKAPGMLGQVNLSAFTNPAAAEAQRQRNVAAESSEPGSTTAPAALGAAHATLLNSATGAVLMTSYGRYTVTTSLPHAMFPPAEETDVLLDLTRRAMATTLDPNAGPTANPSPASVR